jgi:hypothetical protein
MKQVQKILLRPYPIVLGLLALFLLVGVFLFRNTASANQGRIPTLTPGTYTCTNTFNTGPMAGQTEQETLTFNSDGTMSAHSLSSGLNGQGYWWAVNILQVNFSFRVPLPPGSGATDVQIVHLIIQNNGKSFTSRGEGLAYNNGTPLFTGQTTTQCTLQ